MPLQHKASDQTAARILSGIIIRDVGARAGSLLVKLVMMMHDAFSRTTVQYDSVSPKLKAGAFLS